MTKPALITLSIISDIYRYFFFTVKCSYVKYYTKYMHEKAFCSAKFAKQYACKNHILCHKCWFLHIFYTHFFNVKCCNVHVCGL